VRTFDGRPWNGLVDIITGGFPCQDISIAGTGKGLDGDRSGLWSEMRRIICEVGPRFVFVENSPALTYRGLGRVLGDLAALGYDARWGVLGAVHAGAPHRRERIWIVADSATLRSQAGITDPSPWQKGIADQPDDCGANVSNANGSRCEQQRGAGTKGEEYGSVEWGDWWAAEPGVGRMADVVAARVDRLRCLGNGQVPAVVAKAWSMLSKKL
jgi:DNA (cytosine-5)-methyltransferase 1